MATKKIVISDEPEGAEATEASSADEAVKDEAAPQEAAAPEETPAPETDTSTSTDTPESEMPKLAEETPQDPPHQGSKFNALKPKRATFGRRSLVIVALVVIVLVAGAYFLLKPSYSIPLPKSVTQQATFKVYYPQSTSNAYTYAPNSANYAAGKLMYTVTLKKAHTEGASPFVRVSEQPLVGKGPDLNLLPNFTVFNAPAGKAAISPDGQVLNGVLVTDKTLVILNGLGGVTHQDLVQFIKSM